MKKIIRLATYLIIGIVVAACSTYETTLDKRETQTNYNADGKITSVVLTETGVKEFKEITNGAAMTEAIRSGDANKATDRGLSYAKFSLGYADIGLDWSSVELNSTGAPATPADADAVLANIATIKKAAKTTIQTDKVAVNADVAKTSETSNESDTVATAAKPAPATEPTTATAPAKTE